VAAGAHTAVRTDNLASELKAAIGQSVFDCYQCGKCTAGCPLASQMDYMPHQILRLLQHTEKHTDEQALRSFSIWLCVGCQTCVSRCPQEVDLPKVMDYLRQQSHQRRLAHPAARDILAFHEAFLASIRRHGRLHEVGLIASYKFRTGHFLQDVATAPKLLARGKLRLLAQGCPGRKAVARIFERTQPAREQSA
jgi:heterodisulfide reductase subunit C